MSYRGHIDRDTSTQSINDISETATRLLQQILEDAKSGDINIDEEHTRKFGDALVNISELFAERDTNTTNAEISKLGWVSKGNAPEKVTTAKFEELHKQFDTLNDELPDELDFFRDALSEQFDFYLALKKIDFKLTETSTIEQIIEQLTSIVGTHKQHLVTTMPEDSNAPAAEGNLLRALKAQNEVVIALMEDQIHHLESVRGTTNELKTINRVAEIVKGVCQVGVGFILTVMSVPLLFTPAPIVGIVLVANGLEKLDCCDPQVTSLMRRSAQNWAPVSLMLLNKISPGGHAVLSKLISKPSRSSASLKREISAQSAKYAKARNAFIDRIAGSLKAAEDVLTTYNADATKRKKPNNR